MFFSLPPISVSILTICIIIIIIVCTLATSVKQIFFFIYLFIIWSILHRLVVCCGHISFGCITPSRSCAYYTLLIYMKERIGAFLLYEPSIHLFYFVIPCWYTCEWCLHVCKRPGQTSTSTSSTTMEVGLLHTRVKHHEPKQHLFMSMLFMLWEYGSEARQNMYWLLPFHFRFIFLQAIFYFLPQLFVYFSWENFDGGFFFFLFRGWMGVFFNIDGSSIRRTSTSSETRVMFVYFFIFFCLKYMVNL